MPDHTSSAGSEEAHDGLPALSFPQFLLRAAIEESSAPRFLLSLFDADKGEHEVVLDAVPLAGPSDVFWRTPSTATLHVEGRGDARWANLVCGLQVEETSDMIYFTATLDGRGLRAAYRPDEGEPRGDEQAFSEIELTGAIPPEAVSNFTEALELPQIQHV